MSMRFTSISPTIVFSLPSRVNIPLAFPYLLLEREFIFLLLQSTAYKLALHSLFPARKVNNKSHSSLVIQHGYKLVREAHKIYAVVRMHASDNGLACSRMRAFVYVCMNETPRPIQDRFVRVGQIARAGLKGEETRTSWISMG